MFPRTQRRKAISTVLTTLIILVASVVLGTGVVLYGTSLFQTGAQSQAIATTGTTVWIDTTGGSGWAWGAADVRNNGDKLLSIDSIQVRGQQIPFANWYANSTNAAISNSVFQSSLNYTSMIVSPNSPNGALTNGTAVGVPTTFVNSQCVGGGLNKLILMLGSTSQNQFLCLSQQNGPVSLAPGQKAIIYFEIPQRLLTSVDAGSSASVALYAGKVGSPITVTVIAK